MAKADLTAERLRQLTTYNPETGEFIWNPRPASDFNQVDWWNLRNSGSVAGSLRNDGYIRITLDRRPYTAHRLAWLFMTGSWPTSDVDHIDGNRRNNRWANLRVVSRSVNLQNQRRPRNGKDTPLGVVWHKARGKWIARIHVGGVNKHLGVFTDKDEAHAVYLEAKRALHAGCAI